jgi:hypothetical protein
VRFKALFFSAAWVAVYFRVGEIEDRYYPGVADFFLGASLEWNLGNEDVSR